MIPKYFVVHCLQEQRCLVEQDHIAVNVTNDHSFDKALLASAKLDLHITLNETKSLEKGKKPKLQEHETVGNIGSPDVEVALRKTRSRSSKSETPASITSVASTSSSQSSSSDSSVVAKNAGDESSQNIAEKSAVAVDDNVKRSGIDDSADIARETTEIGTFTSGIKLLFKGHSTRKVKFHPSTQTSMACVSKVNLKQDREFANSLVAKVKQYFG